MRPGADPDLNERMVLLREMQLHPVTGAVLHADFYEVDLTERLAVKVPLHFVGKATGVVDGGILQPILRELEVECLPTEIPDFIEVDVSGLGIHDVVHVERPARCRPGCCGPVSRVSRSSPCCRRRSRSSRPRAPRLRPRRPRPKAPRQPHPQRARAARRRAAVRVDPRCGWSWAWGTRVDAITGRDTTWGSRWSIVSPTRWGAARDARGAPCRSSRASTESRSPCSWSSPRRS